MKPALLAIAGLHCLQAQVTIQSTTSPTSQNVITFRRDDGSNPTTWNGFLADLRTRPGGTLAALGGSGVDLSAPLAAMLKQEPLVEFNPLVRALPSAGPIASELRSRQAWGSEARWICFAADGRVLASGTVLPGKPVDLAARLLASGYRDAIQILEAFLREHPDQMEGRMRLLELRMQLAQRRLQPLLVSRPNGERALAQPLTLEEDSRIFGPVARELGRFLSDSSWPQAMEAWKHLPGIPEKGSPTLRAAARKHLPAVETVLRRAPSASAPWSLWVLMAEWTEGRDLLDLVQGLEPLPGQTIPPQSALKAYLSQARAQKAWVSIREIMRPGWIMAREAPSFGGFGQGPAKYIWDAFLSNLMEAQLRLGQGPEAERTLKEALEKYGSPELSRLAAKLAEACGQPGYAKAWAQLPVPEKAASTPVFQFGIETKEKPLDRFIEGLSRGGDQLVVLDDGKGFLKNLRKVLDEEPCAGWDLDVVGLSPESVAAPQLRAREDWGPEPRWALMGGDGRVKANGADVPAARILAERLETAGLRTNRGQLEALLRRDQARGDALTALFWIHLEIANTRMQPHLKDFDSLGGDVSNSPAELRHALTEEEDQRIWGPVAETLERLMAHPDAGLHLNAWQSFSGSPERLSPLIQASARRLLPGIEERLAQLPTHWGLWQLWILLSTCNTGWDPNTFIAGLHPLPDAQAFPPQHVVSTLVKQLREQAAWKPLRDFAAPRWAATRERTTINSSQGDPLFMFWPQEISPLLEALLRLGDRSGADRVVRDAMAWAPSKGLPAWSSELARKCGETGLAEQWAKLEAPSNDPGPPRK